MLTVSRVDLLADGHIEAGQLVGFSAHDHQEARHRAGASSRETLSPLLPIRAHSTHFKGTLVPKLTVLC